MAEHPLVIGITGASGAVYAQRLLQVVLEAGYEVHLTMSDSATHVFREEVGSFIDLNHFDPAALVEAPTDRLHYWHWKDFSAGIASGSFRTRGMALVPCSMSTLGSLAAGITNNLIQRAADVHLKERRPLVLVPRETPLHLIALENMARLTQAGAIVLPASPGFYHAPKTIDDLVNFVVARICDHLKIDVEIAPRWGSEAATHPREPTYGE